MFPLVLLNVVDFAESVDLAVHECSYNVDETLNCAQGVISVRIDHASFFIEIGEDFVVSVTFLKVLVSSLVASTNQINSTVFRCDRPGVKRNLEFHLNWSFFEFSVVNFENVSEFLVPLERMNSTWNSWLETILNVIVNSKVCFDQAGKTLNNFILVFVHESLKL